MSNPGGVKKRLFVILTKERMKGHITKRDWDLFKRVVEIGVDRLYSMDQDIISSQEKMCYKQVNDDCEYSYSHLMKVKESIESQQVKTHGSKFEDIEDPKLKAILSASLRSKPE